MAYESHSAESKTGKMQLTHLALALQPGRFIVRGLAWPVSAGMGKVIIKRSRVGPLQNTRARPELVREFLINNADREGVPQTLRILSPPPLGYLHAGITEALWGMRVASA